MATPNPHTPGHRSPSCDNPWSPWPTPRSPTSSAAVHPNTTSSTWNSSFAGHVAANQPKTPADQGKSPGVLTGSGMVEAMAAWLVDVIPVSMGPHLAFITGLVSIPMTFFTSNDAFYFGVLPVLNETA